MEVIEKNDFYWKNEDALGPLGHEDQVEEVLYLENFPLMMEYRTGDESAAKEVKELLEFYEDMPKLKEEIIKPVFYEKTIGYESTISGGERDTKVAEVLRDEEIKESIGYLLDLGLNKIVRNSITIAAESGDKEVTRDYLRVIEKESNNTGEIVEGTERAEEIKKEKASRVTEDLNEFFLRKGFSNEEFKKYCEHYLVE